MHHPYGHRQAFAQLIERHVVQENRLPLAQHHRGQQKLIPQIQTLESIEEVLTGEKTGDNLILPPIGAGKSDQLKRHTLHGVETIGNRLKCAVDNPTHDPA